jgi:hypothetical protein
LVLTFNIIWYLVFRILLNNSYTQVRDPTANKALL